MVLIPWAEMRAPRSGRDSPLARAANNMRRGACQFRRSNPELFRVPRSPAFAANRALASITEPIWDNICDDYPLAPTDVLPVPLVGGHCPVFYRLLAFVELTNGQTASDLEDNIPGPIQEFSWTTVVNGPTSTSWGIRIVDANGNVRTNSVFTGNPNQYSSRRVEVVRLDGQPDNCPAPVLPEPVPPVVINNPVDVDVQLGDQNVNIPITLNDYSVDQGGDVTWSPEFSMGPWNFTIQPDGVNIDFSPQFPFAPEVDIDLDVGGIGGAVAQGLSTLGELLDLINTILERIPENGGGTGECDLTPVLNLINCYLGETNVQYSSQGIVVNPAGGTATIPTNTVALVFQLNSPFSNATRTQNGSGAAPGVVYWGWFAVGRGEPGERRELQYARQSVVIPKESTTLVFNPIHNNTGTVTAITKTLNCS